jgi:hypothetical protein
VDLQKILSDLKAERDRIGGAIEALAGIGSSSGVAPKPKGRPKGRRRGGTTPEARRRISLAMKNAGPNAGRRWGRLGRAGHEAPPGSLRLRLVGWHLNMLAFQNRSHEES